MATLYSPKIVTDGLVLALDAANTESYPGSGTVWNDLSGNGNDFELYNNIQLEEGKFLYGDSTNAYGRSVNTFDLSSKTSITVISTWKQISTSSSGIIYEHTSNWNTSNNGYGGFGLASNSQGSGMIPNWNHHQLRGNVGYSGYNALSPSTENIQHYTTVHNFSLSSQETQVYINSNLITSTGGSVYDSNNTSTFGNDYLYLWSRGGSSNFNSTRIGTILIYDRVLTASEILQNDNATNGRFGL